MILEWIEFNFVENSLVILLISSLTSLHKDRFERLLIILQKKEKRKKYYWEGKSNYWIIETITAMLNSPTVQVHLKKFILVVLFEPKKGLTKTLGKWAKNCYVRIGIPQKVKFHVELVLGIINPYWKAILAFIFIVLLRRIWKKAEERKKPKELSVTYLVEAYCITFCAF